MSPLSSEFEAGSWFEKGCACGSAACPDCAQAEAPPTPVRVVTYNIHGWRDTHHVDNFERLVAAVRRMRPDVLALQEVLHPFAPPPDAGAYQAYLDAVKAGKGNGYEFDAAAAASTAHEGCAGEAQPAPYLERFAAAVGLPHIAFGKAVDDGYFGRFGYGNAILSRFPIVTEQHHVVRAHPKHQAGRRIEAEDRCFSAVKLEHAPGRRTTFCVTHLDQLSDELRQEQVSEMLEHACYLGPHVLLGDFNVFQKADCSTAGWDAILADAESKKWPPPPERTAALDALVEAGYRDAFYLADNHVLRGKAEAGHGWAAERAVEGMARDAAHPGASCWVVKPLLRIDYCFLSNAVLEDGGRVRQHVRVLDEASDHFPVMIDLELAAPRLGSGGSSAASSRATSPASPTSA